MAYVRISKKIIACEKYLDPQGWKIKLLYLISCIWIAPETNLHIRNGFSYIQRLNYHQKELTKLQDIQTGLVEGQPNRTARITIFPISSLRSLWTLKISRNFSSFSTTKHTLARTTLLHSWTCIFQSMLLQ